MKEKSKTSKIFKNIHAMVRTQFQMSIQVLKTDNERDFFNSTLGIYLLLMALFIKVHVSTHHNKMVWHNAKIDVFLRWLDFYSSLIIFLNDFGGKQYLLQPISSIGCLLGF